MCLLMSMFCADKFVGVIQCSQQRPGEGIAGRSNAAGSQLSGSKPAGSRLSGRVSVSAMRLVQDTQDNGRSAAAAPHTLEEGSREPGPRRCARARAARAGAPNLRQRRANRKWAARRHTAVGAR